MGGDSRRFLGRKSFLIFVLLVKVFPWSGHESSCFLPPLIAFLSRPARPAVANRVQVARAEKETAANDPARFEPAGLHHCLNAARRNAKLNGHFGSRKFFAHRRYSPESHESSR
jgi:hypothetical protein